MKSYVPDTPKKAQITQDFESREVMLNNLASFVTESGYGRSWPPDRWGLEELMYAGLYLSPRLEVARKNIELSEVSAQSSGLGVWQKVQVATEYHTKEVNGQEPWGVGFAVDLPFFSKKKREALSQKSLFYLDGAALELTQEIWSLHSSLRNNLFRLAANEAKRKLYVQKIKLAEELNGLIEARFSYGFTDRQELDKRRFELGLFRELELDLEMERLEIISLMAGLIGISAADLQKLDLETSDFDQIFTMEALDFRGAALRNRIDLQKSLIDFGIADVELKLALIKQYPEISIAPGYFWDQGDNIWNFALGLVLPNHADAFISQAEASRSLKHLQVKEKQINILVEIDRNHAAALSAQDRLQQSSLNLRRAHSMFSGKEDGFSAGDISRVELYDARLNYIQIAERFIDNKVTFFSAVAELEDSCQTPLVFKYRFPMVMNKH
ncbi:MAG: TolC family protein [Proteobacteria bacterium]|nr:TolC family protein [Pseudomonadota bacterium]